MSITVLQKYLPENSLPYLKKWFGEFSIHIKITKGRNSKLGDYRRMPDKSHQITVNGTLEPHLFFFVLTHELAHLIAFEQFHFKILPHGKEWKRTFAEMLLESIEVYPEEVRTTIIRFSKSPKANFSASPELVRYFNTEKLNDEERYIEDLKTGEKFRYKSENYLFEGKRKKNYLCKNLHNGKMYLFRPLVKVEKTKENEY